MGDPFIGEIRMFGGNYPPEGWAFCDGQEIPISQNQALFALVGTTYGGNGQTTFALPDLRGRIPLHQGPGYPIGQSGGAESVTLTSTQLPQHAHMPAGSTSAADATSPAGAVLAQSSTARYALPGGGSTVAMNPATAGITGGSQPHDNMQPYLCVSFIIALTGIFPSRS